MRCNYHGWLCDETGHCIEQPYEDIAHPTARFKDQMPHQGLSGRGRPVCSGPIWTAEPAPLLPDWEPFTWTQRLRADRARGRALQLVPVPGELVDPVHFEWMHDNWQAPARPTDGRDSAEAPQTRVRGVRVRLQSIGACAKGSPRQDSCGRSAGYACGRTASITGSHFEWRVPVDDENTLSVAWFFCACRRAGSPMCKTGADWIARSGTSAAAGSPAM